MFIARKQDATTLMSRLMLCGEETSRTWRGNASADGIEERIAYRVLQPVELLIGGPSGRLESGTGRCESGEETKCGQGSGAGVELSLPALRLRSVRSMARRSAGGSLLHGTCASWCLHSARDGIALVVEPGDDVQCRDPVWIQRDVHSLAGTSTETVCTPGSALN